MLALMLFAAGFATDFEAGNGKIERVSGTHFRCAVTGETDQDKRNRQPSWFYFRLDGVAGRELTIELTGLAGEYNYRPHNGAGLRNMRPVYSYDNEHWTHFETAGWDAAASTIRVRLKAARDRVWIARQPPYTTARLERLLRELRVKREVVGKTVGGRPVLLATVTNPKVDDAKKKVVWLMARQHAWESGTSWVTEGLLRFLVSGDPRAARIRDGFVFKVFPMADPDGVARGGVRYNNNGYDLNRNWDAVDARLTPEIAAQKKAMYGWLDAGRAMDLFVTLHNTEAADFIEGPAATKELGERFWKLLADTTTFYSPKGPRVAPVSTTPGMKGRMSVNQALSNERKAPAYLMELMVDRNAKTGRCPTVADRLEFGGGLARAMCEAVAGR